MSMNTVVLTGNLTRDPEIGTTPNGVNYCRFSIAVQRKFANAKGEREADFFTLVAWKQLADTCHTYLKKGQKVGIVGSLQTRTYEVDGQKRTSTEVIVNEVEFLSSATTTLNGEPSKAKTTQGAQSIKPHPNAQTINDDDIPF